ncbi:Fur family transcriptional regulator [Pseudothermotoga hypogea DSM 11164 = NBRC 106472]|uniref:Fur family transcriptional regulator n=1 Tax=Pseudothermotoga hypogea DSM 11164 = NBRC 106472 TaxID=1123384 RepID=A0A0X1KTI2_9THEM|nr:MULTISPECIES: Fur family transcriptional regulator [Pseudothermotoga]AJC74533.1 Fur family transcriptional regulator [Pseudothermotoga hypogea DSM 11164 = NBRC 106472]MBC7122931.1 transcriptional repressor [Pseudothermotoga sp.]MDI6862981.1 Fur family transcriptional regulator [Pseudothermotoga sp.]
MTTSQIADMLRSKGLKVTPQRVEIIRFLQTHRTHPTAQQIYEHVLRKVGSVSFTTIYNTVRVLEQMGQVRKIPIIETGAIYDIDTSDHGHFVCEVCGSVYDISYEVSFQILGQVKRTELVVYGVCEKCAGKDSATDIKAPS